MNRLIALILALTLLLCGCGQSGDTANTEPLTTGSAPTAGHETHDPSPTIGSTQQTESTAPDQTVPTESSELPETTGPQASDAFEPYTIQVSDPDRLIYAEPGFERDVTASFGEAGVYTIVEECYDRDGNLWGRLKSGIGWTCLTVPPIVPIHAQYADGNFQYAERWHCAETDYVTDIGILPNETLSDVRFMCMELSESLRPGEVLYTTQCLEADEALLVSVVFYGDMTTYGLSFVDAKGNERFFTFSISGKDGSLICMEQMP